MKHTKKIMWSSLSIAFCVGMHYLVQADAVSDWWKGNVEKPTEKAFVQLGSDINTQVIKPTEKAFVQLGKDIEKTMGDFGTLLEQKVAAPIVALGDTVVSKFNSCSSVVALGSEWAAKKAAYEAAQSALVVANEMNEMGPVSFGVYAAQQAATLGLDAGQLGADGLALMVQGLGTLIGGGFNITEVSFDVEATDLEKGKLPMFQMKGIFFGQSQQLTFQFDVMNPEKSMEDIVKELVKLIPGIKT